MLYADHSTFADRHSNIVELAAARIKKLSAPTLALLVNRHAFLSREGRNQIAQHFELPLGLCSALPGSILDPFQVKMLEMFQIRNGVWGLNQAMTAFADHKWCCC